MSSEEREQEVVAGLVDSVIVKGESKWQVAVKPDGSQYAKKLWTKTPEQMQALTALIGQHTSILCNASYWKNAEEKQIRSLWVDTIGYDGPAPTPEAAKPAEAPSAPQSTPSVVTPDGATVHATPLAVLQPTVSDPRQQSIERQTAVKVAVEYMALMPEEHRSVDQMLAVAEQITRFLANGEGPDPIPF